MNGFKIKEEWIFRAAGIILLLISIAYVFYSLRFMVSGVRVGFDTSLIKVPDAVKFNVEEIDRLNLR